MFQRSKQLKLGSTPSVKSVKRKKLNFGIENKIVEQLHVKPDRLVGQPLQDCNVQPKVDKFSDLKSLLNARLTNDPSSVASNESVPKVDSPTPKVPQYSYQQWWNPFVWHHYSVIFSVYSQKSSIDSAAFNVSGLYRRCSESRFFNSNSAQHSYQQCWNLFAWQQQHYSHIFSVYSQKSSIDSPAFNVSGFYRRRSESTFSNSSSAQYSYQQC